MHWNDNSKLTKKNRPLGFMDGSEGGKLGIQEPIIADLYSKIINHSKCMRNVLTFRTTEN